MLHKHERKRKPQTRRKRKQTDKRQSYSKPYMSTSSYDWKFNKTKLCGLFTLNWTNQWTRKRACKVFSFIVHPAYERMRGEYLVEWLEEIKWEDWRTENIFIMERSVEYPSAYWFPVFLLSFNKCYRDGIILGWKVKKKCFHQPLQGALLPCGWPFFSKQMLRKARYKNKKYIYKAMLLVFVC